MNNTLDTALVLANCGIKVYPLAAGSKVPVQGSHGEHDATDDPNIIRGWFNSNPNYNLAINLKASELAVVDLDRHSNSADGVKNYSRYLMDHGTDYMDSLKTYIELTPQNGIHIFYKLSQDLGNKDIQLMPGVELLTGKTTIAPSFISEFNKGYSPQLQGFTTLTSDNVQPLPDWIIDLVNANQQQFKQSTFSGSNYQPSQKKWTGHLLDDLVHGTEEGDRNTYLTSLTGKLFRTGADSDSIYNLLTFANSNCKPPLPEHEVNTIFGSILKRNGGQ